jgi:hypothetical protein
MQPPITKPLPVLKKHGLPQNSQMNKRFNISIFHVRHMGRAGRVWQSPVCLAQCLVHPSGPVRARITTTRPGRSALVAVDIHQVHERTAFATAEGAHKFKEAGDGFSPSILQPGYSGELGPDAPLRDSNMFHPA